jgi:hypothetical protein
MKKLKAIFGVEKNVDVFIELKDLFENDIENFNQFVSYLSGNDYSKFYFFLNREN